MTPILENGFVYPKSLKNGIDCESDMKGGVKRSGYFARVFIHHITSSEEDDNFSSISHST